MPNRPIIIESFRDIDGTVEIVGLGGVSQPHGQAQEAEIQVLLMTEVSPISEPCSTVRMLNMGCGQLDLLVPGSRWSNGTFIGESPTTSVTGLFERVREENLGIGLDPQPYGQQPFPSGPIADASGFLLRRSVTGTAPEKTSSPKSLPDFVLLPQMELLRCLFGVSNGFLLELFDGIRNPAVSGERGLVDRRRSRVMDDGTVLLAAGRPLSRDEALIAAAVVADRPMRTLHDSAFQQMCVSREWHGGGSQRLQLAWPWTKPVPIELHGRWVVRSGESPRRFIVTRISSIGIPLPFMRVEVHHPGAEGAGRDDLPPPAGRTRYANARVVVLTVGRAASSSRRPVELSSRMVDFQTASDIEVLNIARGGRARTDGGGIGEAPRDEGPFGTGGRQPGADLEVGAAIVRRRRVAAGETAERSELKALDATWDALFTACSGADWSLSALPRYRSAVVGAKFGGLDLPKEPLVAVVRLGPDRVLVVDRGSLVGDERSLGILVPLKGAMSERQLAFAARELCTSLDGRWRSPNSRNEIFRVIAVARPARVWDHPEEYAKLLRSRIASALGF